MANGYKLMEDEPLDDEDQLSLVERVFPNLDKVSEGEYIALYEFLLNPDISNDPEMIASVLREFSGWAQSRLNEREYPPPTYRHTPLSTACNCRDGEAQPYRLV